ncbi:MAG: hypothetical protein RIQ93_496 [Verrucomicrobiota bacterium]|jgi:uncharacterized membrane protein YbhN (UPF0104 family)
MISLFAFLETRAGRILRYGVSVGLVLLIIESVDWPQLWRLRGQFSWSLAVGGVALAGLIYPLHALRWLLLLRAQGLALPWRWAHGVTWIAQFYNSFLLGGLGGDAARIFYLCRDAPAQKSGGLASVAIDRIMGLLMLLVFALVAFLAQAPILGASAELRWVWITATGILASAVTGLGLLWRFGPERWPGFLRARLGVKRLDVLQDLFARTRQAPRPHLTALGITAPIWLIDMAAVWLLARSVGLPLPFLETCLAVTVAYTAMALPISVGGHGVREGALIFTLGLLGLLPDEIARERALLTGALVWANTMLWSLGGGMVLLAAERLLPPSRLAATPAEPTAGV